MESSALRWAIGSSAAALALLASTGCRSAGDEIRAGTGAGDQAVTAEPAATDRSAVAAPADPAPPADPAGTGELPEPTSPAPSIEDLPPPVVDPAALPAGGIGVTTADGPVVLLGSDGTVLGSMPGSVDDGGGSVPTDPRTRVGLVVDGEELSIDAVAPGDGPAFGDCVRLHAATEVELPAALCGEAETGPDRIDILDPVTGERRTLAGPPAGRATGAWSWALVSPDGRWVAGRWRDGGETTVLHRVLPTEGPPPGSPPPENAPVDGTEVTGVATGWTDDGHLLVERRAGGGRALELVLVDPDAPESTEPLVEVAGGQRSFVWHRVELPAPVDRVADLNDRERRLLGAFEALGVEQCCGEPSHGGDGATLGMVWQGSELFVWAASSATPPIAPATPLARFTCADTAYAVAPVDGDTSIDTVAAGARALAGVLECDPATVAITE